ncbi:MAG: PKD domain-containing protein [Flavobacteriales bacterium]|nr:PKD domain-containing protein [Flavobacteriales bacterium]MEB2342226.1 PKD domain-containing protein [Flavobacteriia bacterium]
MQKISLSILLALGTTVASAQQHRVLFIGNSYTGVNNLPEMTRQLALSLGDTLVVASSNPGGYTFSQHCTNAATQGLIDQGDWDFVVLQEQSQLPSFPPAQVASQCLPYAQALVDSIRAHSVCAEPVFYMTWGRENGDAQNCAAWPPVCTYEGMQQQLRISYLQMAEDNSAECAPAGMAWKHVRDNFPTIDLYASDGSHPSVAGSYLVACTMYSTFFRKSTVGAGWLSTLDANTAATLQQVASNTVLDSLDTWNIGVNDPVAAPTFTDLGGGQVQFSENSTHATSHFWDLGDGSTSTESSFTHSYAVTGDYTVTYIAMDDCGRTDTSVFEVAGIVAGIHEQAARSFRVVADAQGLFIHNAGDAGTLHLFDLQGRTLRTVSIGAGSGQHIRLASGQGVLWRFVDGRCAASGMVVVP